jgi:hypothetical protein
MKAWIPLTVLAAVVLGLTACEGDLSYSFNDSANAHVRVDPNHPNSPIDVSGGTTGDANLNVRIKPRPEQNAAAESPAPRAQPAQAGPRRQPARAPRPNQAP